MDITDIEEFKVFIFKRGCGKCQYQWFPRAENPKKCPRCQVWLWDDEVADNTMAEARVPSEGSP